MGAPVRLLELERAAYVVDVRVGHDDLLELEARLGEALMNARDIVAGVDDDGLVGLFIAEDGAVAGERADGKGLEDHGSIVGAEGLRFVLPRSPKRGTGAPLASAALISPPHMYRKSNEKAKTTVAIRFLFAIMRPWPSLADKKKFWIFLRRSLTATAIPLRLRRLRAA